MERKTDGEKDRWRDRGTERQKNGKTDIQPHRERQRDKETERQKDRKTDRQQNR